MSKEKSDRSPGRPSIGANGSTRIGSVVPVEFKDKIEDAVKVLKRLGFKDASQSELVRMILEDTEKKWVDIFTRRAS